ncbi:MAG TPA: hypothetical protein VLN26_04500 [Gaiellaceae bacterium]|nr:hypothetical protein [Gaiellaceae bacterium]
MLAVLLAPAIAPPAPTSGRCAGAWNAGGPAGIRRVVASRHVLQLFVGRFDARARCA